VLSSATQLVEIIPGSSRTRFRDRPETVRLHRGIGVHLHPGILFGFTPECCSESSRNRVHLRPDSPPRLRPKSYTDYESLLRLHIRPVLGTRPLGLIVQFDIQSVYAQMFERGLSARTVEYTNAVLQSAFRQAVRWKMLAEDPCVGVDLPRMKR
jgi:hypothetical protein